MILRVTPQNRVITTFCGRVGPAKKNLRFLQRNGCEPAHGPRGHCDFAIRTLCHYKRNTQKYDPWISIWLFGGGMSETGRIRFRRVRFQTPNSVSFSGLSEFRGANSMSSSQPIICVPKRTHRVSRRTHRVCRRIQ